MPVCVYGNRHHLIVSILFLLPFLSLSSWGSGGPFSFLYTHRNIYIGVMIKFFMNIIGMRQAQRALHVESIKKSIEKAMYSGEKIVYEKLVLSTMVNLNLSKTTAKDYIERALYMLEMSKEKLEEMNSLNGKV